MAPVIPDSIPRTMLVLVIDDLPSSRKVVMRMLGMLGFTNLKEAAGASDALQTIKETTPRLVITDLHLKDGKGTDLIQTVQQDSELKDQNISFIVITSDMDKQSFAGAIKAGISSYLLKPFSPDNLAERIITTLQAI